VNVNTARTFKAEEVDMHACPEYYAQLTDYYTKKLRGFVHVMIE